MNRLKAAALAIALLFTCTAWADEITVGGATAGAFDGAASSPSASLGGLSFSSANFSNTTSGGFASLALGQFTLDTSSFNYMNHTFNLLVNFTLPLGIDGTGQSSFTAKLIGSVTNSAGGVFINFNNALQEFTFSNSAGTGSFQFQVNDVSPQPSPSGQ